MRSAAAGIPYLKGHATENDFVILPDHDGALHLSAATVAAICDRRAGLGGDGVLRVVRTAACPEAALAAGDAEWFMDYRNADGSVAEMCGNGVRLYARYLFAAGLVPAGPMSLATRNGMREVEHDAATGLITVDMGVPTRSDTAVEITLGGARHGALPVEVGNPHAVVVTEQPVAEANLLDAPVLPAATFPHGANVEVVNVLGPSRLRMRVFERGVGETRSCGTGACAAAAATGTGQEWAVEVPGGLLDVGWSGDRVWLRGPAVLVAEGVLRPEWLAGLR